MAGCQFGSPDLVTSISGTTATPTFAFDAANTNYFGLVGSFTSTNGTVCSFPTRSVALGRTSTYAITPLIVTTSGLTGKTTTCSVLAPPSITPSVGGSTTYSGIECPTAIDNQFAPGTYTLRFSQPVVVGAPSISSRVFVVASPIFVTDSVAATFLQTTTASAATASTSTVTEFTSTATETASSGASTTTIIGSAATTITVKELIQTCANATSTIASPTSSSESASPTATLPVSLNGQCGNSTGQTCLGSTFGNCCSLYGYCGASDIYCLTTEGCQSEYGTCTTPSPVSSSAMPTSTIPVSLDGSCGGTTGYVCAGSGFGDCCSPYGWCGSTRDHCGPGCQPLFGACNATSTPTGSAPLPSSTLKVSLDGACGGTTGQTCVGSDFGTCCSEYGYCGATADYCGATCQPEFGICSTAAAKRAVARQQRPRAASPREARGVVERAIGGAGPDYTYPPIPHTTVTAGVTQVVTVTPSGGVSTTTVLGVSTTTVGAGVVTITEVGGTARSTETVTASLCS